MINRKNKLNRRKAAAAVELAVCLPVIVILALGSMEAASMIFLRQALVQSAYEAAKVSVKPDSSQDLATLRAQEVLGFRDITGETITFEPANTENLARGEEITVTVSAPGNSNSVLPFGPFRDRQIAVSATMQKE